MRKSRLPSAAFAALSLVCFDGTALEGTAAVQREETPVYGYRIVHSYPHDPQAFTQGLAYREGFLYESTGRRGRSSLRQVRPETGEVVRQEAVDSSYFAEGLALQDDRLVQLTWQSGLGFLYDVGSFRRQGTFRYSGEGWGLAGDGTRLIMSDGSDTLRVLDPSTFGEQGSLRVTDRTASVRNLNELEYVDGEIYANVWHTDRIARISPDTGRVLGWIDLTGLLSPLFRLDDPEAVLNGIAFDPENHRLFVTGKLWPRLFEIDLVEPATGGR